MKFKLPDELPATVAELDALIGEAQKDINLILARAAVDETELTPEDVAAANLLSDAMATLQTARAQAVAEEEAHTSKVSEALSRAKAAVTPVPDPEVPVEDDEPVVEASDEDVAEVVAQAEKIIDDKVSVTASTKAASDGFKVPVSFAGTGASDAPEPESGPGWLMVPGAPGYRPGKVGFKEMAEGLDAIRGRGRSSRLRPNRENIRGYSAQKIVQLSRGLESLPVHEDPHALRADMDRLRTEIPGHGKVTAEALTAAGGWCAPSEQLYTFCDVPTATDLISLPDVQIRRGGIRFPIEPDLSSIFASFEFFYTEPELEEETVPGTPDAVKTCVEVPCPDTFEEVRLNVLGYCVEAGILQNEGWPESIEWFMRSLAQEHLRALSRRTVLDMVAGSGTAKVIPAAGTLGTAGSVLNSLSLMATNLRLNKGLGRTATIEGVAPSWLFEVMRADLAYRSGVDTLAVSDGQISSWLTARNISLQLVGDWQTRATNQPGNLATLAWPATVQVLLYPAGTWFRSLSNVIEMGVMYPKEQLQLNRYTAMFVEDAIAVFKRCNQSILVTVPICVSGAVGVRKATTCAA